MINKDEILKAFRARSARAIDPVLLELKVKLEMLKDQLSVQTESATQSQKYEIKLCEYQIQKLGERLVELSERQDRAKERSYIIQNAIHSSVQRSTNPDLARTRQQDREVTPVALDNLARRLRNGEDLSKKEESAPESLLADLHGNIEDQTRDCVECGSMLIENDPGPVCKFCIEAKITRVNPVINADPNLPPQKSEDLTHD